MYEEGDDDWKAEKKTLKEEKERLRQENGKMKKELLAMKLAKGQMNMHNFSLQNKLYDVTRKRKRIRKRKRSFKDEGEGSSEEDLPPAFPWDGEKGSGGKKKKCGAGAFFAFNQP